MLPHWKQKKLTLVVIPEADAHVRQFRLPLLWACLIPAALIAFAAIVAALGLLQSAILRTNSSITTAQAMEMDSMEQTVATKDRDIERLQQELMKLAAETEDMRVKVKQLRTLELELKPFTTAKKGKTAKGQTPQEVSKTGSAKGGVGGEYIPVEVEGWIELARSSQAELQALDKETERLHTALLTAKRNAEQASYIRSITPSIFPTVSTTVSSAFGKRKDPFTRRSAYHRGIDFSGHKHDPIYATAAGEVTRAGHDRAMGNYVFINHGNGLETIYMHLTKVMVRPGQSVKQGERIGTLGSTGRSTGPHLHYEVHKHGKPVNPKPYLLTTKEG